MRKPKSSLPWPWLGVLAIGLLVGLLTWRVGTDPEADPLALALLQVVTLALSLVGSFFFGRNTAREAAQDVLRPHARNSFRLVQNLAKAFQRLGTSIGQQRTFLTQLADAEDRVLVVNVQQSMELLEVQVLEQIGTATNALEGWRDILPDEVEELERRAEQLDGINEGPADV
jgi:hypothetical protein